MLSHQEFFRQWVDGGSVYDRKLKRTATQDLRILKDELVQIRMNAYASGQEETKPKPDSAWLPSKPMKAD